MSEYLYYIYAYISKKTGLPYYIGKGKGRRAYVKHETVNVPKDKSKIIFLETNLSNVGSLALERRYIRWYGRKDNDTGILRNRTDGGDGYNNKTGPLSKEDRERIYASRRRPKGPHSEERKHNISKSKLGKLPSDEARQKMSESRKGRDTWNKGLSGTYKNGEYGKQKNPANKKQCENCNLFFRPNMLSRYHGDKCKNKIMCH
jgi:hypothetical protein